jgi:4-amino-4-deoxy-L-arabinose transferase
LREPDFWHYFFWVEHIKRFAAEDAQHARPPWFYVVYLPLMAWPWILSWPTALRGLFARMRQDSFVLYLVLWFALPFIFFSITRGKMLTYVLPCFPALSILLAIGLERLVAQAERTPLRAAVISLAVIQALGLAGILAAQAGAFGFPPYAEAELLKVGALCTLLTSSVAVSAFAARAARTDVRIAAISIGAAVLLLLFQIAIPQRALDVAAPVSALTNYTPSRDAVLISDAQRFGTIAWAFKRDDVYVVSAGEIAYGLSYPEERYRELDGTMLRELIATSHPNHDIVIICKSETAREIMPDLPPAMTRTVHGSTVVLELARAK